LTRTKCLPRAVAGDLNQRHIGALLQVSQTAVASWFGCGFTVYKPFHAARKVRVREIADVVRDHYRRSGRAALIGFSGHWSVIRDATGSGFRLLDSSVYRQLPFRCILVGEPEDPEREDRFWIVPSSLFLLGYAGPRR
jgi:hypothetical protein